MAWTTIRAVRIDHTQCGSADSPNFRVCFNALSGGGIGLQTIFRTVANGGDVNNLDGSGRPCDLFFCSDPLGAVKIPWEIVTGTYVATTGAFEAWFQVANLSHTVDGYIYVAVGDATINTYQGNSSGVYPTNQLAAWHLANGTALDGSDSTANALTLTNHGMTAAAAVIDGGALGTGGQYMQQNSLTALQFDRTQPFTISLWVELNGPNTGCSWIENVDASPTYRGWALEQTGSGGNPDLQFFLIHDFGGGNYIHVGLPSAIRAAPNFVTFTYDGSSTAAGVKGYLNGVSVSLVIDSDTLSASSVSSSPTLLAGASAGYSINNIFDNVEIANVAWTPSWILASYNNQKSASTFLTLSLVLTLTCPTSIINVGSAYDDFFVPGGGGTGPFTYSITSGSLAPGLSLNAATGEVFGIPTAPGPFSYTARVVDSLGNIGTANCTMQQMASSIPFADSASHISVVQAVSSKWTGPFEFETLGISPSGRPGANPNELAYTLASGNNMERTLTPGYSTMAVGFAWITALNFSNSPLTLLHSTGATVGLEWLGDGTFLINGTGIIGGSLYPVTAKIWKNGVVADSISWTLTASSPSSGHTTIPASLGQWSFLELIVQTNNGTFYYMTHQPSGGGSGAALTAVYVNTGELFGEIYPAVLYPNLDGAVNNGVPKIAGPNYAMCNDRPPAIAPNNDTTYFSLFNVGDEQTCYCDELLGDGPVWGVQAVAVVKKATAGTACCRLLLRNYDGREYQLPLAPGVSNLDRYPSYSPDGYDYSQHLLGALRLNPFTGVAWVPATDLRGPNRVQVGLLKTAPQAIPGTQNLIQTSSFEGSVPFTNWNPVGQSQTTGRHGQGFLNFGGQHYFVGWSAGGGSPAFSVTQIAVGRAFNQTAGAFWGVEFAPTGPGLETVQVQSTNGLIYLSLSGGPTIGPALQTFTARHWYHHEVEVTVLSLTQINAKVYQNGEKILDETVAYTPPPFTTAYNISPGSGNQQTLDDWYVNAGQALGDGWSQTQGPGGTYAVDPNPEIRVTWMGLEVIQGPPPIPPTQATLQLIKSVSGGGDPTLWTLSATGPTPVSGPGGVGPIGVDPGTYALSETTGPPNYTPGVWSKTGGGTLAGSSLTLAAGDNAVATITNTFGIGPTKASHRFCVAGTYPTAPVFSQDDLYIVREYKFVAEPMPSDTVFFTPWSNLGWPYDKTARNLVVTIDTAGVACSIAVQADGQTMQTVSVTTLSNDRDRTIALLPNLTGKMWRLALTPGTGGKAQLFAAALDHVREPGAVTFYDSLEQDFGFIGFKVMKQGWMSYKSTAPITLTFLVDGGLTFYSVTLPAHVNRDIERFFLPVVNGGVLGKSKKIRIQVNSASPFFLYADSIIEFIPIGQEQRRSFALMSVHPEQQQPVSSPTLGQWDALSSIGAPSRSVSG